MSLESLKIELRRCMQERDDKHAAQLAVQIAELEGEPEENDKTPSPIPTWGTDV